MKKIVFWAFPVIFAYVCMGCVAQDTASTVPEEEFVRSPVIKNVEGIYFSVEVPKASCLIFENGEREFFTIKKDDVSYLLSVSCISFKDSNFEDFKKVLEKNSPNPEIQITDCTIEEYHGKKFLEKRDDNGGVSEYFLLYSENYQIMCAVTCHKNQLTQANKLAEQMIQSVDIQSPKVRTVNGQKEFTFFMNGEEWKMYLPLWMKYSFKKNRVYFWADEPSFSCQIVAAFETDFNIDGYIKGAPKIYVTMPGETVGQWTITNFADNEAEMREYVSLARNGNKSIFLTSISDPGKEQPFTEEEKVFLKNFWKETALLENK